MWIDVLIFLRLEGVIFMRELKESELRQIDGGKTRVEFHTVDGQEYAYIYEDDKLVDVLPAYGSTVNG